MCMCMYVCMCLKIGKLIPIKGSCFCVQGLPVKEEVIVKKRDSMKKKKEERSTSYRETGKRAHTYITRESQGKKKRDSQSKQEKKRTFVFVQSPCGAERRAQNDQFSYGHGNSNSGTTRTRIGSLPPGVGKGRTSGQESMG